MEKVIANDIYCIYNTGKMQDSDAKGGNGKESTWKKMYSTLHSLVFHEDRLRYLEQEL
ncbi:hypothetical protein NPIL_188091, partial [Nephila pilipes]